MYFFSKFFESFKVIRYNEIPEYFSLNVLLFKAAGHWVPHPKVELSTKVLNYAYNIILFVTAATVVIFETTCLPITYEDSLIAFIKNFSLLMTHLMTLCKFVFWARNRKELVVILNKLDDMAQIHGEYLIDPDISPEVHQEDFQPVEIIKTEKKLSDFAIIVFFIICNLVPVSACCIAAGTLFFDYQENFFQITNNNVTEDKYDQLLPYFSTIPFNYNTGRFAFFCAIMYQFYGLMYYALNIIAFDTLFACIMNFICVHAKIVQGAFRTIRGRCLKRLRKRDSPYILCDDEDMQNAMIEEFNKCVRHLQQIFITTDALEYMFTGITFIQVGMSLIVFCTNLYIVSSVPVNTRLSAEMIYLAAVLNELMLYCYFGHRVILNVETIPDALFNVDWLPTNVSYKRSMIFTMTRMSKPIYFTVGKFSPLTLNTFVSICRGSYSFFTVLKSQGE